MSDAVPSEALLPTPDRASRWRLVAGSCNHPLVSSSETPWVTERLTVDGTTVHCRRSTGGDGIPIVHVHGFAISGSYLMPTAQLLARRWVNVVPDLPGYGRSERRGRPLDIPALGTALLGVLDALGIEKAVLVGNSMGCPVALEVAHAVPERVQRLVLVSPAGGVQNRPLVRALGQLARDGLRESPRMLPVAVPDYVRFGPVNGLRLFRQLTLFPSLERLVQVPVPALAVMGLRDPLMPSPNRVREVAQQSAELVMVAIIDAAAHAVNFSHPVELAATIEAWLDDELGVGSDLPEGVRVFVVHEGGPGR
jgi:pimeloyl-ACP methyl ester carboxylesterase